MSPPNPEDDPVHRGLHDLGRQIEEAEGATWDVEGEAEASPADSSDREELLSLPEDAGADADVDDEMPWPSPPPAAPARSEVPAAPPEGEAEAAALAAPAALG